MNNSGKLESIFYFKNEGRVNISKTAELSIQKAIEEGINKIIVFTSDGEGPLILKRQIGDLGIDIIAVTFPNKMPFFLEDENGGIKEVFPETSTTKKKDQLKEKGITIVQGAMPLEDIVIPGARDSKFMAIKEALGLVSGGLNLCVQAVLMATDNGAILPGEKIISMSADTSIISFGTNTRLLFHPSRGLNIYKIICKPINFSISKE